MTLIREAGTVTQKPGGRFKIGVITPGTGSSGTYPRETIEAAGRDKVFAAGTHMYLDHATEADSFQRPEGSIRDLVGILTEDAYWDEAAGGLVAEARIYSNWRPVLEEMKDDIGVSIRASGEVREDKGQRVITRLSEARSVDFVTRAGRGGRILEVIESARMREASTQDTREQLQAALQGDTFVRDFDPDAGRVWYETEHGTYEQAYSATDGGIALQGEATEVVATTKYVPKANPAPAGKETAQKEEAIMADTPNDATSRVDEADPKTPTPPNRGGSGGSGGGNETEVEKLRRENAALKAEIAELKRAKAKEAREAHVAGIVEEAFKSVEAPTTKRLLIERLSESEDKDDAAILAEAQSIAGETKGIGAGSVHGMGESAPVNHKESEQPQHTAADTVNLLEGSR